MPVLSSLNEKRNGKSQLFRPIIAGIILFQQVSLARKQALSLAGVVSGEPDVG
jgi:hypothetical protein